MLGATLAPYRTSNWEWAIEPMPPSSLATLFKGSGCCPVEHMEKTGVKLAMMGRGANISKYGMVADTRSRAGVMHSISPVLLRFNSYGEEWR